MTYYKFEGKMGLDDLDKMIEQITVDAYGDDEQLWAFRQVFEDNVELPADGFVMHGYGLCLWRLGRFDEAGRIFHRLLWLNPWDNQGIRFLIDAVKAGVTWEDEKGK